MRTTSRSGFPKERSRIQPNISLTRSFARTIAASGAQREQPFAERRGDLLHRRALFAATTSSRASERRGAPRLRAPRSSSSP